MTDPSIQQSAIRTALLASRRSLLIQAGAGSGKTTTAVWLARTAVPQTERSVFLAFGKAIAEELRTRLPYWVTASTYHALGYAALRRACPRLKRPTPDKCKWLLKEQVPDWKLRREIEPDVLKLVSFGKAYGTGAGGPILAELADSLGLDTDLAVATELLHASNSAYEKDGSIDFDDQLYLPYLLGLDLDKYDNVFIDEAQDTNAVQLGLTRRMLFPGGRVVAIGDRRQAIYAFRGAGTSAMDDLRTAFDMEELPLSVSFRCARTVVDEVNHFLLNPKPQRKRRSLEEIGYDIDSIYDN